MSQRITHEQVRSYLQWARNYGEIIDFQKIAKSGRCWMIEVEPGIRPMATDSPTGRGGDLLMDFGGVDARTVIPEVMVLTTREALLFGWGLAVAGLGKPRTEFGDDDWNPNRGRQTRCKTWREEQRAASLADIERRREEYRRKAGKQKQLPRPRHDSSPVVSGAKTAARKTENPNGE